MNQILNENINLILSLWMGMSAIFFFLPIRLLLNSQHVGKDNSIALD